MYTPVSLHDSRLFDVVMTPYGFAGLLVLLALVTWLAYMLYRQVAFHRAANQEPATYQVIIQPTSSVPPDGVLGSPNQGSSPMPADWMEELANLAPDTAPKQYGKAGSRDDYKQDS